MNTSTNEITGSISVPNYPPTGTVTTFSFPTSTAFTNSGEYAYETNYGFSNTVIINTSTNSIIRTLTGGFSSPFGIEFSPSGAYAYVTNLGSSNVVVLNTSTGTVTSMLTAGTFSSPRFIAFSPSGAYAYITDNNAGISIVNTSTGGNYSYLSTQSFGLNGPQGIALSKSGKTAYIVDGGSDYVTVLSTGIESATSATPVHVSVYAPSHQSSSAPEIYNVMINDNISDSLQSNIPVITAYLLSSDGKVISSNSYFQNQLPAIISITSPESAVFSFACSFVSGGRQYRFADNVYGIGITYGCGSNYTLVGGQRTVLYSSQQNTSNVSATVKKAKPLLEFVKECQSSTYDAANPVLCATEAEISTNNSQLQAELYLNGVLVGNTFNTISKTESLPGNYSFTFKTAGNENYTGANVSYSFSIIAQQKTSPNSTSAIVLNSSERSKTIPAINLSENHTELINFTNANARFLISLSSGIPGTYSVKISNVTNTAYLPPSGMSVVSAVNISVTPYSPALEVNITMGYLCNNTSGSQAKPYVFANGTWTPAKSYSTDNSTCEVTFKSPSSAEVALFAPVSKTAPSAVNSTSNNATSSAPQQHKGLNAGETAAAVAIAAIVIIAAYLAIRHMKPRRGFR